jgi:hypothetical protein
MPVFIVVARHEIEKTEEHINALPKESVYKLNSSAWLIDYEGTTRALAELLKIRGADDTASGIVFSIQSYSGRFAKTAWEWLGLHLSEGSV